MKTIVIIMMIAMGMLLASSQAHLTITIVAAISSLSENATEEIKIKDYPDSFISFIRNLKRHGGTERGKLVYER